MLVLSRKLYQKVILHGLETSVQVVGLDRGTVRLGIDAPPEVVILREELKAHAPPKTAFLQALRGEGQRELRHTVRNGLNAVSLGLALVKQQQERGLDQAARATLDKVEREIHALGRNLDESARGHLALGSQPVRPRRALLVEDDPNERELLAGFLRMAGVGVDVVGDGLDALDYLHNHERPDVVLLDMGLPRCDGPTTVREIRRDPACQGMKIFAVTGHTPGEYEGTSPGMGIDRWFLKPLDPQVLLRDINQELAKAA